MTRIDRHQSCVGKRRTERKMPNRLKELRTEKGLSQNELADALGVVRQQISKIESGERQLTQKWMVRLGRVLDCDPIEILNPTDAQVLGIREVSGSYSPPRVRVVGFLGAKDLYYPDPHKGPWETIGLASAPLDQSLNPDKLIALRILSGSPESLYAKDDLAYFPDPHEEEFIPAVCANSPCLVETREGMIAAKVPVPNDAGTWDLRSQTGEPLVKSVSLKWAQPLLWIQKKPHRVLGS